MLVNNHLRMCSWMTPSRSTNCCRSSNNGAELGAINPVLTGRPATATTPGASDYVKRGGYQALKKHPRREDPAGRRHQRGQEVGLRGRGGAGFPDRPEVEFHAALLPGRQVRRLQLGRGEPGTFKDRDILRYNPHSRDRGHGHRRLRDGRQPRLQLHPRRNLGRSTSASKRRSTKRAPPVSRQNILGRFSFDLFAHHGYGAYICGEETALLESIEGKKGQPRFKPPFPASFGLYGKPTTINNTETFAPIPFILNMGGEPSSRLGKPNNGGTKLFSVSGHVNRPATTRSARHAVRELLEMAGGMRGGRKLKGGHPRRFVGAGRSRRHDDGLHDGLRLDRQGRLDARFRRGHRHGRDHLHGQGLERLSFFYYEESCGQCTPCREGTGWLYRWCIASRARQGRRKTSTC